MVLPKCIVYVLKSESAPRRYYTGLTSNLSARLDAHNAGHCSHTAAGKPWIIDVIVEFADEPRRAVVFKRYLKLGRGAGQVLPTRHWRRSAHVPTRPHRIHTHRPGAVVESPSCGAGQFH